MNCDRCGAIGRVRLERMDGTDLVFCKHHFDVYELALLKDGFGIVEDTRDELLVTANKEES